MSHLNYFTLTDSQLLGEKTTCVRFKDNVNEFPSLLLSSASVQEGETSFISLEQHPSVFKK